MLIMRINVAFLLLIILSCSPGEKAAENFFPLKEGMTWEYEGESYKNRNCEIRYKQLVTVLAPIEMDGKKIIPIKYEYKTPLFSETTIKFIAKDVRGIYIYKIQTEKDKTPQHYLKNKEDKYYLILNPVKNGINIKGKTFTVTIDRIDDIVTVPGRTYYNCVKVLQTHIEDDFISTLWFCEGIGIVKAIESFPNGDKRFMQLIKYKASDRTGVD